MGSLGALGIFVPVLDINETIVISNKNRKLFLLKFSYSKKYLSQSKLKFHIPHFKYTTRVFLTKKVDYSLYYY
jgi:hypothetical protein